MMQPEVETRRDQQQKDSTKLLLNKVQKLKGKKPLVLAPSTSSVTLAKQIAEELGGDFAELQVKKLTDPKSGRMVGAVSEWGTVFLSRESEARGLTLDDFREAINSNVEEMQTYRKKHPLHFLLEKRPTLLVDVGSRTGYRLMAAIQGIQTFLPTVVVVATPSITHRAFALANNLCDEIIALEIS